MHMRDFQAYFAEYKMKMRRKIVLKRNQTALRNNYKYIIFIIAQFR